MIGKLDNTNSNYSLQGTGTSDCTDYIYRKYLVNVNYLSPEASSNLYYISPLYIYKVNQWFSGIIEHGIFQEALSSGSYEDTVISGKRSEGIVSSFSNNSVDSTGENWITNEFAGKAIVITSGIGNGQERTILSNTNEQIIVDENWTSNPAVGDEFVIADKSYRHFGWSNVGSSIFIREINI